MDKSTILNLEIQALFKSSTRIFSKERKYWTGRKKPKKIRDAETLKKEEIDHKRQYKKLTKFWKYIESCPYCDEQCDNWEEHFLTCKEC